jgi:hypothetical protein
MRTLRNISFAAFLALVLLSGTVKLGATPDDWCPENCWCLGLDPDTTFVQIDCTVYQECTNEAYLDCERYCGSHGWAMAFDGYAYGNCLSYCTCVEIPK